LPRRPNDRPDFIKRVFVLSISVTYFVFIRVWRWTAHLAGMRQRTSLVLLTYHSLPEEEVARFERQMRDLSTRTVPVFADSPATSDGRQTVAVTFDDGFSSVFENALPVMAKYHVPATVFIPTGFLGCEPEWIDPVSRARRSVGFLVSCGTLAALDGDHVRVGSHTVTHQHLTKLSGDVIGAELTTSKRTLESIVGRAIRMLSLPYGSFNVRVLYEARTSGYERVFTNVPVLKTSVEDLELLGRVGVAARDWPLEFRLKSEGYYDWLALAVPAKRAILRLIGRQQEA
jgi:peptidoglycan/xylan/chitin deacetylase (PgdA/CDA1 family)